VYPWSCAVGALAKGGPKHFWDALYESEGAIDVINAYSQKLTTMTSNDPFVQKGLIRLPLGSERVVDADEEVSALFESLALADAG
jgi:hypothetical protein